MNLYICKFEAYWSVFPPPIYHQPSLNVKNVKDICLSPSKLNFKPMKHICLAVSNIYVLKYAYNTPVSQAFTNLA